MFDFISYVINRLLKGWKHVVHPNESTVAILD